MKTVAYSSCYGQKGPFSPLFLILDSVAMETHSLAGKGFVFLWETVINVLSHHSLCVCVCVFEIVILYFPFENTSVFVCKFPLEKMFVFGSFVLEFQMFLRSSSSLNK